VALELGSYRPLGKPLRHLKATIFAGILVATPLVVTYLVLRFIFSFAKDLVVPLTNLKLFEFVPHGAFAWVALGLTAIILYVLGVLTKHALSNRLLSVAHRVAEALPGAGAVYRIARQATETFAGANGQQDGCRQVVMVDFPRKGLKTVGLVTGRVKGAEDESLVVLYIPTSPNPTSGFTALVPEHEVISTHMSVEDAMKLVISGGVVFPDELGKYASNGRSSLSRQVEGSGGGVPTEDASSVG